MPSPELLRTAGNDHAHQVSVNQRVRELTQNVGQEASLAAGSEAHTMAVVPVPDQLSW